MTVVPFTPAQYVWELPRDTRVFGKWSDGSRSAVIHRLDGSYCSLTTENGTKSAIHHATRVRRRADGKFWLVK